MKQKMTNFANICITSILLLFSLQSFGNTCGDYFKLIEYTSVLNAPFGLQAANKLPVSEAAKAAILKNPKIKALKEKYNNGRGLTFLFPELWVEGNIEFQNAGTNIQASYTYKLLQFIFPEAGFRPGTGLFPGSNKKVRITVEDSFLSTENKHTNGLPMSYLKVVNSSTSFLKGQKQLLKRKFNFNSNPIVHIYYDYSLEIPTVHAAQIKSIVKQIKSVYPNSNIILSVVSDPSKQFIRSIQKSFSTSFDDISLLSDAKHTYQLEGKTYFVINNTRGLMPYLHAASEAVVIKGPINLFEGLHVGTKTLIFNNESTLEGYSVGGYKEMVDTAVGTGGAIEVEQIKEITSGLRQLSHLPESFLSPANVPIFKTITEMDSFLDVLASYVEQQIQNRNTDPVKDALEGIQGK